MNNIQKKMQQRWDEKGWDYDKSINHGVHNQQSILKWQEILDSYKKGNSNFLLDVGTGTGFVSLIASRLGYSVTGIDWSETMLFQAREKSVKEKLNITFIHGKTESLPFHKNYFDVITARHVLWTLSQPDETLRQWFDVLKKGGSVIADYSIKNSNTPGHHYDEEIEQVLPLNKPVQITEITQLFASAGFTDIKVEKFIDNASHINSLEKHTKKETYLITCIKP